MEHVQITDDPAKVVALSVRGYVKIGNCKKYVAMVSPAYQARHRNFFGFKWPG